MNIHNIDVLNYAQYTGLKEDYVGASSVCEYPDCNDPDRYFDVIDPDDKITSEEKISITFTYPLTNEVTLTFENKGGFTRLDMFRVIYEGYVKIYEDALTQEKAYNRPYEIWGHDITDLFIEGVEEISPTHFKL